MISSAWPEKVDKNNDPIASASEFKFRQKMDWTDTFCPNWNPKEYIVINHCYILGNISISRLVLTRSFIRFWMPKTRPYLQGRSSLHSFQGCLWERVEVRVKLVLFPFFL